MNKQTKKDYFHLTKVDHQELMTVLLHHFGHCSNIQPFIYRYQKGEEQNFLDITTDEETGNIIEITPSQNFPSKELEQIEKLIQETLITDHGIGIGETVAFCHDRVDGYFRYKDVFQIIPMPDDAPKANVMVADHPFLLQFTYKSCPDTMVGVTRRKKKAVVYTRLLNLLSNRHINLGLRYAGFAWALNSEDINNLHSKWKQLGYSYKGQAGKMDEYSDVSGLKPIERLPNQKYYSELPVRSSDSLALPDNLEASLDLALSLDKENSRKFFMACSWYAQYEYIWHESSSAAFIALVTALECLAKEGETCKYCSQVILKGLEICEHCKQPRYRIIKHFKEFLERYVPFIDQLPKEKKILYELRSKFVHGLDLLQQDLEPWSFLMQPKQDEQREIQRNLYFITGGAIYNWLWMQAGQLEAD